MCGAECDGPMGWSQASLACCRDLVCTTGHSLQDADPEKGPPTADPKSAQLKYPLKQGGQARIWAKVSFSNAASGRNGNVASPERFRRIGSGWCTVQIRNLGAEFRPKFPHVPVRGVGPERVPYIASTERSRLGHESMTLLYESC